jgi:hypothetical protein
MHTDQPAARIHGYHVTELETDVKIFLGLPPHNGWSNMSRGDGYFDRFCASKYGEAVWSAACKKASDDAATQRAYDENPVPPVLQHPNSAPSPQAAALAAALMDYIDMTGGADGMSTGSGKDPRIVRAAAVVALKLAGFTYGPADGSPGSDSEYERQRGTLHPGGIRTPGFVSRPEDPLRFDSVDRAPTNR